MSASQQWHDCALSRSKMGHTDISAGLRRSDMPVVFYYPVFVSGMRDVCVYEPWSAAVAAGIRTGRCETSVEGE